MAEKLSILLCEDDENLGMLLREYLNAKGYNAELCPDGDAGYKAFLKNKYDLCVLDVMMPKRDGISVLREMRARGHRIPVLILSAKAEVDDKVLGLDSGANDYLTKPFSVKELLARPGMQLLHEARCFGAYVRATRRTDRFDFTYDITTREAADALF